MVSAGSQGPAAMGACRRACPLPFSFISGLHKPGCSVISHKSSTPWLTRGRTFTPLEQQLPVLSQFRLTTLFPHRSLPVSSPFQAAASSLFTAHVRWIRARVSSSGAVIFSITMRVVQLRTHKFSVLLPSLQHTENILINCSSPGPAAPAHPWLGTPRVWSSPRGDPVSSAEQVCNQEMFLTWNTSYCSTAINQLSFTVCLVRASLSPFLKMEIWDNCSLWSGALQWCASKPRAVGSSHYPLLI